MAMHVAVYRRGKPAKLYRFGVPPNGRPTQATKQESKFSYL